MTDPFGPPPAASDLAPDPSATPPERRRAWLPTALVGLAALALGLLGGGAAVSVRDHRDDIATTVSTAGLPTEGAIDADTLELGSCFAEKPADKDDSSVGDVIAQDCTRPHERQVFAAFNLDDGAYPGDAAIDGLASDGCDRAWQKNDQLQKVTDAEQIQWLTPSEDTWNNGHDRYVVCFMAGPFALLPSPLPIASS